VQGGPTTTVDHGAVLADHEVPDLAAQLVTIPGYSYIDPPATEVTQGMAVLHKIEQRADAPDFFAAVSYHGIVADDRTQNHSHTASGGTEVGYLMLIAFRYAPPAGLEDDPTYFTRLFDKELAAPTRLELTDTHVFKFDDPGRPDSRYTYLWIRHGVQGQFDGADAASMERWLGRYLSVSPLSPNETNELAQHVVPVAGFVYVNAPGLSDLSGAIADAFGSAPYSIHKVADSSGAIGALSLIELASPMPADQAAQAVFAATGTPLGTAERQVIAGVPVLVYSAEGPVYVWAAGNTIAILGADEEPAGQTFVEGMVQAWTTNGLA
jgi:hypothetical protein